MHISGLISDAWQLTALLCFGFTSALTLLFNHSLLSKLLIILYVHKVLRIFNHHLNHKCKFTIITGKTLRDHF